MGLWLGCRTTPFAKPSRCELELLSLAKPPFFPLWSREDGNAHSAGALVRTHGDLQKYSKPSKTGC